MALTERHRWCMGKVLETYGSELDKEVLEGSERKRKGELAYAAAEAVGMRHVGEGEGGGEGGKGPQPHKGYFAVWEVGGLCDTDTQALHQDHVP